MIFDDVGDLASAIREECSARYVIVIDGWTGCGKSTLAKSLSKKIDAAYFDLDSALKQDQGSFLSSLNLDVIREAMAGQKRMVVAGICALEVFELVGIAVTMHIYVKRMASWGWADEIELEGRLPELPGASGEVLRTELRAYHQKWSPHTLATHEFHWIG